MKIRISQAKIVDNRHPDNGKKRDILIEDGVIVKIAKEIDEITDEVIGARGLCISIGWMDLRANFRDPGDEQKEDLESGLAAAANGGFTAVAVMPSTNPPIDGKGDVEYLLNR
ncbi:MAG: dihydroorotase, partial [Cryomorphaceae bacterium]